MNPAANASVSGGLAGAIVIILNSWFVAFHFAPMDANVAAAYMVVLTAGAGYFFHTRSLASLVPVKAPALAPVAAVLLVAIVGSYLLFGIAPASAASIKAVAGNGAFVGYLFVAFLVLGALLAVLARRAALALLLLLAGMLAACSTAQQAQLQTDVTSAEKVVQIVQPLGSDVACADQAAANATTTVLTMTGDASGAQSAAVASKITGYLCNGQPAGAVIAVPAADAPAVSALAPAAPAPAPSAAPAAPGSSA